MTYQQFEVDRSNLSSHRIHDLERPALTSGQVRVLIDRFALTANNITYGIVGDRIGYWKFFPAADNWGQIPVWGFADVIESLNDEIPTGERLYGYFPMATEWVLSPTGIKAQHLIDGTEHRAALPPVYNSYSRTNNESYYQSELDDERVLLMPLYATSYCLYDFVCANDYFDAPHVVITSASAKTSIGCAYAFKEDPKTRTIGLTSSGQFERVKALDLYDEVYTYDDLQSVSTDVRTVIIDISGNGNVLSALHERLGDNMAYTSNVGLTHYDNNTMGPHYIRDRSAMFFAPGHIQQRAQEWGPGVFQEKSFKFWLNASIASRRWLEIDRHEGMNSVPQVFDDVLKGNVPADRGVVIKL
ncbi:MAG: DUF2855 family protein [Pseudomonadota bacterium]